MIYKEPRSSPEARGQARLVAHMARRGWLCMKLGGGKYTVGWPDYYCFHPKHGHRWIEMKAPGGKLRQSQITRFIKMNKYGDKVYVLRDERDYMKLFNCPNPAGNWGDFL